MSKTLLIPHCSSNNSSIYCLNMFKILCKGQILRQMASFLSVKSFIVTTFKQMMMIMVDIDHDHETATNSATVARHVFGRVWRPRSCTRRSLYSHRGSSRPPSPLALSAEDPPSRGIVITKYEHDLLLLLPSLPPLEPLLPPFLQPLLPQ